MKILLNLIFSFCFLLTPFFITVKAYPDINDSERIQPYSKNPKYWQYKGFPVLLLGGSDDDNLFNNTTLNIASHLDTLVANGGNYIRNTMSARDSGNVQPHALSGGLYNLNSWNETYWARLKNLFALAQARDIIVQIELWDRWDTVYEGWDTSSWNPKKNSNYTAASSGLAEVYNVHADKNQNPFLKTPPAYRNNTVVLPYQQAFVDKFMSIALNYPNILYNISNETTEDARWSDYWASYIRAISTAAGKTIYITDMKASWDIRSSANIDVINKRSLYDFVEFSQNNQNTGQTVYDRMIYMWDTYLNSAKRPMNVVKIYGGTYTGTYAGGPVEGAKKMWRNIFAGSSSARFHRYDAGLGLSTAGQTQIKSLRMVTDAIDFTDCVPANSLLSNRGTDEAYVLAKTGDQYAVYFPDGGSVDINLSDAIGYFSIQWLNIMENKWQQVELIEGGSIINLKAPGVGSWAVLIKLEDGPIKPPTSIKAIE